MRAHAKLVHVRLSHDHGACILKPLYHRGIVWAYVVPKYCRGSSRLEVLGAYIIFDRDGLVLDIIGALVGEVFTREKGLMVKRIEGVEVCVLDRIGQVRFCFPRKGHGGQEALLSRGRGVEAPAAHHGASCKKVGATSRERTADAWLDSSMSKTCLHGNASVSRHQLGTDCHSQIRIEMHLPTYYGRVPVV